MISACSSQYPATFGGEVLWKRFALPCLDVSDAIVLKRGLEVEGPRRLQRGESAVQGQHKDEARDAVHTIGRHPLLEVAKQGLNEVGRYVVDFILVFEKRNFRCEVAEHHLTKPCQTVSSSHKFLIDDGSAFSRRLSGKAAALAVLKYVPEARHHFVQFFNQRSVLPKEGVHLPLFGSEFMLRLKHVLRPSGPFEHVHPTGYSPHIIGHQVVNIREGEVTGVPDSLCEGMELLVRTIDGFQICPESVAYVPVVVNVSIRKALDKVAAIVRHGIFGGLAKPLRGTVHRLLDVPTLMGAGDINVNNLSIRKGKRLPLVASRDGSRQQDFMLGDGDALVYDNRVVIKRLLLAAQHIKPGLFHPVLYGDMRGYVKTEKRKHEVEHLHGAFHSTVAAPRICVQQDGRFHYHFLVPVSFGMSKLNASALRSSTPQDISFF